MGDCGCEKARAELEHYLRRELTPAQAEVIRAHMETCPGCQNEAHIEQVLTALVRRCCAERAPEELHMKVRMVLRRA